MANILVLLAEGFEEIEGLTVVDVLRRLGLKVTTASVNNSDTVTGSHGITVTADSMFEDINSENFDCVVLPGGLPGTTNLAASGEVEKLILDYYNAGKYLAAICAAPTVFANLGLLKGVRATVNPSFNDVLIEKGAAFTEDRVAKDGRFITSRAMGTAIEFALAIGEEFVSAEKIEAMKASLLAK